MLYCRAGFEGECAAEITERAGALGVSGYARAERGSAFVVFVTHAPDGARELARRIPVHSLIFARQAFPAWLVENLPAEDRITPLLDRLGDTRVGEVFVETADTNEAKELLAFCRSSPSRSLPRSGTRACSWLKASGRACMPSSSMAGASTWGLRCPATARPGSWAFRACDFRAVRPVAPRSIWKRLPRLPGRGA